MTPPAKSKFLSEERINQDYMRAYGVATGSYDVLKQFGAIKDGDDLAYQDLLNKASLAAGDPGNATKWAAVTDRLDMNNYIDYLMVNQYAYNTDWPGNNWRAARRRDVALGDGEGKFRFFVWDAEFTMNVSAAGDNTAGSGGAAGVHSILLTHPSYKLAWKGRVAAHFDTPGGVFSLSGGTDAAVARFTAECNLLDGNNKKPGNFAEIVGSCFWGWIEKTKTPPGEWGRVGGFGKVGDWNLPENQLVRSGLSPGYRQDDDGLIRETVMRRIAENGLASG